MRTNDLLLTMLAASTVGGLAIAFGGGQLLADASQTARATAGAQEQPASVLVTYDAEVPFDLAAPTWLPDGMVLLDGDGPWTRVDLDGDGTHESVRAEIMYGPPGISGMAPVMTSQESGHPLDTLAGGYDLVTLADGTPAWLTVRDDSPWLAIQWNVGDVTRGIQATDVTVEELLRIASSFEYVTES